MSKEEITVGGGWRGWLLFYPRESLPLAETRTRPFASPAPLLPAPLESFTLSVPICSSKPWCAKVSLEDKSSHSNTSTFCCYTLSFPATSLSAPCSEFSRTLGSLGYYLCCAWSGNWKRNHSSHISYLGKFYSMQIKMHEMLLWTIVLESLIL